MAAVTTPADSPYIGRFAPSPTGDLHFGSLVAAVGSYLRARSQHGRWLVRVENIDPPREVKGSDQSILDDLKRFGMVADEPVTWQSERTQAYEAARDRLLAEDKAFYCGCTRADIPRGEPYPGTCRQGIRQNRHPRSVRLLVPDSPIEFDDMHLGPQSENLARSSGDFVIWRADNLPAYQLAVVVDDAWQGITEVVRGQDLLDSTPRQLLLQQQLGLPHPSYLHLPLAVDQDGAKLSKREASDPISELDPARGLRQALLFLGMKDAPRIELDELWDWAISNFRPDHLPAGAKAVPGPD